MLGPRDRQSRGSPQTWRCFLHIVQTLFFKRGDYPPSPGKVIFRCPNLRKQTPPFSDTTSQGQSGAAPPAVCRSPPDQRLCLSRLLFLPSPRKLVRSLWRLARPLVPVFLDTLSLLLVVCTSNRHPLKAQTFSPHLALHHLIVAGF